MSKYVKKSIFSTGPVPDALCPDLGTSPTAVAVHEVPVRFCRTVNKPVPVPVHGEDWRLQYQKHCTVLSILVLCTAVPLQYRSKRSGCKLPELVGMMTWISFLLRRASRIWKGEGASSGGQKVQKFVFSLQCAVAHGGGGRTGEDRQCWAPIVLVCNCEFAQ